MPEIQPTSSDSLHWSTLAAKRMEEPRICIFNPWQSYRYHPQDCGFPEEWIAARTGYMEEANRYLVTGRSRLAEKSSNPIERSLQEYINEICLRFDTNYRAPSLRIYSDKTGILSNRVTAIAMTPEFIELSEAFLDTHSSSIEKLHVVLSHECAHLINEDYNLEKCIDDAQNPPSERKEILADRLGLTLFAKPQRYLEITEELLHNEAPYRSVNHNPSKNRTLRKIAMWGKILKDCGLVNVESDVINNQAAALDLYRASRKFTEILDKVERIRLIEEYK